MKNKLIIFLIILNAILLFTTIKVSMEYKELKLRFVDIGDNYSTGQHNQIYNMVP